MLNPAMDRSDSLMRISDTAEWHHLLEQKMRKNSKKISSPEVRHRPHARPLIGIRLTTKIPPYERVISPCQGRHGKYPKKL